MKFRNGFAMGLILSLFFSNVWALATQFDPKIFERDLPAIGIRHIAQVRSQLGLEEENQVLVVKHVVTTGRNKADKNSQIVEFKVLEKVKPRIQALKMLKRQIPLTNEQLKSLVSLLRESDTTIPAWLSDVKHKKYINSVLQKDNDKEGKTFSLTNHEANLLIDWSIKHKKLVKEDHPA